jgi:glycosyltransferase involved in cell wall biosynthesis
MAAQEVRSDHAAGVRPLVTIGMPIRNGDPYFEQALAAVLFQDYPNLEIIASDNGSTDGTAELLERTVATDPRVHVFRQPETLTAFDNFAWVLRQARGRYFMWAAHDDLRPADYVSTLVVALEANQGAVLAFGDLRVSPAFGGAYVHKPFDYETQGMGCLLRMRRTAFLQCYHIYGLWRLEALRRIPFIFNAWWPDLPLMVAAASLGGFYRVRGLNFDYLEVRKTNEQRALYQDNNRSVNRVERTLRLLRVVYETVRAVSGTPLALLAAWFVIEKQFRVIFGLLTGRIRRGDH